MDGRLQSADSLSGKGVFPRQSGGGAGGPAKPGVIWTETAERTPSPANTSKFAFSELAADWHFFNHGAMFMYGGMEYPQHDPVADWYAKQSIGTDIIQQPFKATIIEGLDSPIHVGNLTWGNVICAVHHEYWDSLVGFLGGVATVDHKEQLYAQMFIGDIEILDPVLVERHSVLHPDIPQITVTVFCADTNKARWEISPPVNVIDKPRFVYHQPRPEVVDMGEAVLNGSVDVLQHKDNPAFQQTLNDYKVLRGETDSHNNDNTNRH